VPAAACNKEAEEGSRACCNSEDLIIVFVKDLFDGMNSMVNISLDIPADFLSFFQSGLKLMSGLVECFFG
jgi:hypothetical protein